MIVGDQSAGKSSVVEAVCDITVPRDQGTCTRCPFQIVTSAAEPGVTAPWQCKITLLRRYCYSPNTRHGRDATRYDGWVEQDAEPFEFDAARVEVTASIGVALGDAETDADRLLANADRAMYAVKARGGSGITSFALPAASR